MTIIVELERVEVNVVEGHLRIIGRGAIRLADIDMIETVPLKEHDPGLNIDLLNDPVEHDPFTGVATVPIDRGVGDRPGGAGRREHDIVDIESRDAVSRLYVSHRLVGLIENDPVAEPVAKRSGAFGVDERRQSLVLLELEAIELVE